MQIIVGYWDLDLETRQLSLCPRSRAMLGIVPNSPALLDHSEWLRSVHPGDITAIFEQISSAQRNREPYSQEFRSVHSDGSEHFILGVGRAVGAKARKSQRFVGFNIGLGLAKGVLEEQPIIPHTTLNELLSWRPHSQLSNWARPALTTDEIEAVIEQLTQAQIDCLLLVDQQLNSKQIARRLGISSHTVDQRIRAALRILHCDRRVHAARLLASRRGSADIAEC